MRLSRRSRSWLPSFGGDASDGPQPLFLLCFMKSPASGFVDLHEDEILGWE